MKVFSNQDPNAVAAHAFGGADHTGSTLADVNTKVTDADLASEAYVDAAVIGLLDYKGGYDAATNTPDLDVSPSGVAKGDTYTVTADGLFFTEQVRTGDMLIAEVDNASTLADWTRVERNVDLASETVPGLAQFATDGESAALKAVQGNDARMSDARTPTAHAIDSATAHTGTATAGNVLEADSNGLPTDSSIASADVVQGPASATDTALAAYDGTTGKLLQDSDVTFASAPAGGSGIAFAQYTDTDPVSPPTGYMWRLYDSGADRMFLKCFDGTDTWSVEMGKE